MSAQSVRLLIKHSLHLCSFRRWVRRNLIDSLIFPFVGKYKKLWVLVIQSNTWKKYWKCCMNWLSYFVNEMNISPIYRIAIRLCGINGEYDRNFLDNLQGNVSIFQTFKLVRTFKQSVAVKLVQKSGRMDLCWNIVY